MYNYYLNMLNYYLIQGKKYFIRPMKLFFILIYNTPHQIPRTLLPIRNGDNTHIIV